MTFDSNQARLAAHLSWVATPARTKRTAPARAAKEAKLIASVDPDGVMSESDRAKAIENARSAWGLSLVAAREAKRAAREAKEAAAAAAQAANRQAHQATHSTSTASAPSSPRWSP